MSRPEREITRPVDLCRPDGRLNTAAIGWTRRPLHRANLRGWGRNKRWEYWGIVTDAHIVGVVASSLDYAGVHGLYVLDRDSGTETVRDAVTPLALGGFFHDAAHGGRYRTVGGGVAIDIVEGRDGTRVRARAKGIELDARMPPGGESLGVVVPWSTRRFQYTVKDVAREVFGALVLDGVRHDLGGPGGFAVLDRGRGRWPYRMTWNWAAGYGAGTGLQLGGKWTVGTPSTENAVITGGTVRKIGEELRWDYDRADWTAPWRITGDRADVTFTPFHERRARTELGIVGSETHQCFGTFTGRVRPDDGDWVPVDGLTGWAEEAANRW